MKDNQNNLFTVFGVSGAISSLRNTALVSNGATLNCDSDGTSVTSAGNNFANDNSCALNAPTDQKGALNALLGPLSGATTKYFVPQAGSPLIDKGANCSTFDQRFAVRFNTCDVGAIEAGGATPRNLLPIVVR
jgi:hypothetical protein